MIRVSSTQALRLRRLAYAVALLLVAGATLVVALAWHHAGRLVAPAHASIGAPPSWFTGDDIAFPSQSGATIKGWLLLRPDAEASVVLRHPIRGNRRSMLQRARFLSERCCSVLLVDLQAHGESIGELITLGHLEARDARAAVDYMRYRDSGKPLFVLGSSLGGVAALLADPPVNVQGLILEAVFPSIEKAIENRLRMRGGVVGAALTPVLLQQLLPRLGLEASQLHPAKAAAAIASDVLVISGDADQRTTAGDTETLYDSLHSKKQLWLVPGARHEDLHRYAGEEYERRVLAFIRGAIAGAT